MLSLVYVVEPSGIQLRRKVFTKGVVLCVELAGYRLKAGMTSRGKVCMGATLVFFIIPNATVFTNTSTAYSSSSRTRSGIQLRRKVFAKRLFFV